MRKKIIKFSFLFLFAFILVGCTSQENTSKEAKEDEAPYKEFDEVAEEFFLAYQMSDYDTMKKYLTKEEIEKSAALRDAKKGEILNPEYKEMIKGKFKITATDFYYKSHNQIIYLAEFYDPASGSPQRFGIYGVEKKDNRYYVINGTDFLIRGAHFKQETGNYYLRISTVKELMETYPTTVYKVKTKY